MQNRETALLGPWIDGFFRDSSANLLATMRKIVRRPGLTPWPKLFQNLRATRATELADQFPSHVATAWLGHSERIADKHYRQVTDDHFEKASAADAARNCSQKQE